MRAIGMRVKIIEEVTTSFAEQLSVVKLHQLTYIDEEYPSNRDFMLELPNMTMLLNDSINEEFKDVIKSYYILFDNTEAFFVAVNKELFLIFTDHNPQVSIENIIAAYKCKVISLTNSDDMTELMPSFTAPLRKKLEFGYMPSNSGKSITVYLPTIYLIYKHKRKFAFQTILSLFSNRIRLHNAAYCFCINFSNEVLEQHWRRIVTLLAADITQNYSEIKLLAVEHNMQIPPLTKIINSLADYVVYTPIVNTLTSSKT